MIDTTHDGGLVILTLNRPEVLNALHPAAHMELADAFDRYAADPALRVAIVTGAGERAFCAGTDLAELTTLADAALSDLVSGGNLVLVSSTGTA